MDSYESIQQINKDLLSGKTDQETADFLIHAENEAFEKELDDSGFFDKVD